MLGGGVRGDGVGRLGGWWVGRGVGGVGRGGGGEGGGWGGEGGGWGGGWVGRGVGGEGGGGGGECAQHTLALTLQCLHIVLRRVICFV